MNLLTKGMAYLSISVLGWSSAKVTTGIGAYKEVVSYAKNNIKSLSRECADKFGLGFEGVPIIEFKDATLNQILVGSVAHYNHLDNKLIVHPEFHFVEGGIWSELSNWFNPGKKPNIHETLLHELGHFYSDKRIEYLEGCDWPNFSKDNNDFEDAGLRIIGEGIGKVFDNGTDVSKNSRYSSVDDLDWQYVNVLDKRSYAYSLGFDLVAPIIELFGRDGIDYLLQNPPSSKKDIYDLRGYQNRIISHLSSN